MLTCVPAYMYSSGSREGSLSSIELSSQTEVSGRIKHLLVGWLNSSHSQTWYYMHVASWVYRYFEFQPSDVWAVTTGIHKRHTHSAFTVYLWATPPRLLHFQICCTVLIRFKATLKNNYVLQSFNVHNFLNFIWCYMGEISKCRIFRGSP